LTVMRRVAVRVDLPASFETERLTEYVPGRV